MKTKNIPLEVKSIRELFDSGEKCRYEIPIYQRNYSWGKEEISELVQDVYDAFKRDNSSNYYIGTLVSYNRGEQLFEIIDGQQRLTTIWIILNLLGERPKNELTFRARKKSTYTIKNLTKIDGTKAEETQERDEGIVDGYRSAKTSIKEIVLDKDLEGFRNYFMNQVEIIHYQVPNDVNLNHYFEVMNSRGEQLEKHEIEKAKLMGTIENEHERQVFNRIWGSCSEMGTYVQQQLDNTSVFGPSLNKFVPKDFSDISALLVIPEHTHIQESIETILNSHTSEGNEEEQKNKEDQFQPIIDFPNFLLVVLKVMLLRSPDFKPSKFNLDDKFLLQEFKEARVDAKAFAFNLLKAKYLLDNYIVHHIKDEDKLQNRPWLLQKLEKNKDSNVYPKNLTEDDDIQNELVQLLSMFEVSFTPRQRKNYLVYCLMYLMDKNEIDLKDYAEFLRGLAERYFMEVYLNGENLNSINTPTPRSFDATILFNNSLKMNPVVSKSKKTFNEIYGDGKTVSKGVPLFVFNYMDYRIWNLYASSVQGQKEQRESKETAFFEQLGCKSFGLKLLNEFYFSRTRRSLEHYYPRAMATGTDGHLDENQINCFGNYAMIGSEANSSGSNWTPKTKLDHYLDASGKISQVSVASPKFAVMMRICKEKDEWLFEDIINHQDKMLEILGLH